MSTEQTISSQELNTDTTVTDDLDSFAAELFGESKQPSAPAKAEEAEVDQEADSDAPNDEQDTHSADDGATEETEANEDEESEDEPTDDAKDKAKPKNRYQERINELTAKARQAERERDELLKKLNEKTNTPKPKTDEAEANTTTSLKAPSPSDKNEDGTDKYPLGEFDPKYVKDTIQHVLAEERAAQEQKARENEKLSAEEQYRATLQSTWNDKLDIVQERYPDFKEKGEEMLSVFEGIDQAYGQYLTDTLMEMDAGPEVFYYLATNLDEAQKIVDAGPRKATIALAKIEAQLAGTKTTESPKIKVTNAPTPPPQVKGSAVAKASISVDTDDLDAFSKVLFKK